MITKSHHFFLLTPNPWAVLSSLSSFNCFFSLLLFFKHQEMVILSLSLILVTFTSLYWWVSYSTEFNLEGMQSQQLSQGVKMSMILFICSEVFFFFSFFWSYFHYFFAPTMEIGMAWPPLLVEMFDFSSVPLINTLVLLSSGLTVTISHHMMDKGELKLSQLYLLFTVALGLFFSLLQLMEYRSSFFCINDGTFGTSFFVLTGFHGLHVIIGTIYLAMSLVRSAKISMSKDDYASFEMASWYWHFVDVIWLFLFFFIYYMNS